MAQKPNSFVHVEIHSNAPEKTKSFLRDVFDWKWQDMPEMNYSMFEAPSAPGGGLQKAENLPAGVLDYILCEDIDGTLKKIQSSGGAVVMPKAEIPGMGWFAVFQDPTGITLALYENAPQPRAVRARPRARGDGAPKWARKPSEKAENGAVASG